MARWTGVWALADRGEGAGRLAKERYKGRLSRGDSRKQFKLERMRKKLSSRQNLQPAAPALAALPGGPHMQDCALLLLLLPPRILHQLPLLLLQRLLRHLRCRQQVAPQRRHCLHVGRRLARPPTGGRARMGTRAKQFQQGNQAAGRQGAQPLRPRARARPQKPERRSRLETGGRGGLEKGCRQRASRSPVTLPHLPNAVREAGRPEAPRKRDRQDGEGAKGEPRPHRKLSVAAGRSSGTSRTACPAASSRRREGRTSS